MNHGVALRDAYVALGSNLGDPVSAVRAAVDALARLPDGSLVACSRLYRTPPWGVREQPDFINAVVHLRSSREPLALLGALQAIEADAGRCRDGARWGPRTLDLDLLHVDGVLMDTPALTLPHPRLADRAFVLLPLHDVAPTLVLPGWGPVARLLDAVDRAGCVAID